MVNDRRDTESLILEANEISDEAKSLLDKRYKPNTQKTTDGTSTFKLAHYSTLQAIISMLQNPDGGLRLSDSSTMNDPEEGKASADGRFISSLLDNEFSADAWIRRRYEASHICCFVGGKSRDLDTQITIDDDLLFWRLYGGECRGVSLTLSSSLSNSLLMSSQVQEVVYANDPPMRVDLSQVLPLLQRLEKLHTHAISAECWDTIYPLVLPNCDSLMAQRFLQKLAHYDMEREFRAVKFVTNGEEAIEDKLYTTSGYHVQYRVLRRYVEVQELACRSIFSTDSVITIGRNVPEIGSLTQQINEMLEKNLGHAPNVVKVRTSKRRYRAS